MREEILIVDDEEGIRDVLRAILEDEHYTVHTAADGFRALELMKTETIDLVVLDVWLPNKGGIDVLEEIKAEFPETEVVIISGHGNIDLAVKAVKMGAFDFLEKPLSLDRVLTVCRNALKLESLRRENRELRAAGSQTDRLLGESPEMKRVKELIEQSAKTDSTILVTGENGTGKELVAREVHNASRRSKRPFVEVNCAAIPDNLIESELFGHEKGAFTHAISQRRGKFEAAHRGTLFLDEVADMSLSAQAKVLRVIQELTFERIGGNETITVDVRLIAATNKDIQAEIADGNFREDLYYRLNVIPIEVAPLRERPEDIALLVGHFMERFKQDPEAEPKTLTDEALDYLKEYPWQGNVRELKNFVERVNIMTDEPVVTPDLCEYYLGGRRGDSEDSVVAEFQEMGLNDARDEFERRLLVHKLQQHSFNITKTAQSLGIYPSNLHGKIKKFGIEVEK